jgi:hypothetical protein
MFEFAGGGARAPIEAESRSANAPASVTSLHLTGAKVRLTHRKPVDIREKIAGGVKCI